MFGLLNVNKPVGPTSHDVVARVRRVLGRKVKVGHAGTLDPFASGVLVVCVGPATRLAEYVVGQPKQYVAEVTFGATSTTDDVEGQLTPTSAPPPSPADLEAAISEFIGTIDQVPPAHSAVHVNGRRAYQLAREDRPVELPARPVRIDAIELMDSAPNRATLRIDCHTGTYIRALARDLGSRLGCGGYCSALMRTRVGNFELAHAVALDTLNRADLPAALLDARLAVADMPTAVLDAAAVAGIRLGRAAAGRTDADAGAEVAALDDNGRLIALCRVETDRRRVRPVKVFPENA